MDQGIIRISRGREYFGYARKLLVYLDGTCIGKIQRNKYAEFTAAPGLHTIYVRMDWCLSPALTIDLAKGEMVDMAVTIPIGQIQRMIDMYFKPSQFFGLERTEPSREEAGRRKGDGGECHEDRHKP